MSHKPTGLLMPALLNLLGHGYSADVSRTIVESVEIAVQGDAPFTCAKHIMGGLDNLLDALEVLAPGCVYQIPPTLVNRGRSVRA